MSDSNKVNTSNSMISNNFSDKLLSTNSNEYSLNTYTETEETEDDHVINEIHHSDIKFKDLSDLL